MSAACLVDAAIASECFDGEEAENIALMAYAPWTQSSSPSVPNYPRELWTADWHERFMDGNDARQTLTWKNNFTDLIPTVHNFYSSTEDVLATLPGTPNSTVIYNLAHFDFGRHAWVVKVSVLSIDKSMGVDIASRRSWPESSEGNISGRFIT